MRIAASKKLKYQNIFQPFQFIMFKQILKPLTISLICIVICSQVVFPAWAGKNRRKLPKTTPSPVAPVSKPVDPYDAAKKDLSEDWYVLYRIIDRLARANQLDKYSWRITIPSEYEVNAFATDGNLIAVYNGILDQLGSDSAAIACVVAHEMAHHAKRHIALGQAQQVALLQQLKKEAQEQAIAEMQQAQQPTGGDVLLGILGAVSAGLNNDRSIATSTAEQIEQSRQERIQAAKIRAKKIFLKKEKQFKEQNSANIRQQELEADEVGYKFVAKAGFDAQGCIRAMEILARTPGAEFDTDHPAVPKRIRRFKELMSENSPESLAERGNFYLQASRIPLTYELSKDGASLRINSNHGSSAADDLERQFRRKPSASSATDNLERQSDTEASGCSTTTYWLCSYKPQLQK